MTTSEGALLDASVFGLVHIVSETLTLHFIEHWWYHPHHMRSFCSMDEAREFFDLQIGTPQSKQVDLDGVIPFHVCRGCYRVLGVIDRSDPRIQNVMFPCPTRRIISRTLGTDDSPALLCPVCKREGTG